MAIVSLLETFGVDASGSLKPGGHLGQAFTQLFHLQKIPLDQVQLVSGKADLKFLQPVALPLPGLALTVGAGLHSSIQIRSVKDRNVSTGDPFDPIPVHENEIYVCLELGFSAAPGVAVGSATCAFGLSVSKGLSIAVQRRFFRSDGGAFPLFGAALAQLLQSFLIPQSYEDLAALDRDVLVTATGTGKLALTSVFGLSAAVQQLAATSPIAGQVLQVNNVASFTGQFGVSFEGGYLSRIRRLEDQTVEIGISQPRSVAFNLQVSAAAGVVAGVGSFDLAEKFIAALSRNPVVDLEEFRRALPGEDEADRELQITAFQNDLSTGLSTSIAASVKAELSHSQGTNPVFVFHVASSSLSSPATSAALVSAMNGDFSHLTTSPLPAGITQVANIFTSEHIAKQQLSVNLLGLVNFVSVGKLARIAKVERNAQGDITCATDSANGHRLQALLLNVAGNTKRLQSLLSEDFLCQATFKAVDLHVLPPKFEAKHTLFEINNKTDGHRMRELLDVCRTIGLITEEEEAARLQGHDNFGRTTFWLQTTYAQGALEHALLDSSGAARSERDFILQGRRTLGELIAHNDGEEFRKQVADLSPKGDALWRAMERSGNRASFNSIFGLPLDAHDPRVEAAGADYACISSWASAMKKLADAVVEVRTLVAGPVAMDDARLTSLRLQLRDRMAEVVKHSGEHFGEPLGLVTVFLCSGGTAGARVIATGESIQPLTKSTGQTTLPPTKD